MPLRSWPRSTSRDAGFGRARRRCAPPPAAQMKDEAGLVGHSADDLHLNAGGAGDPVGVVGALGESLGDDRVA